MNSEITDANVENLSRRHELCRTQTPVGSGLLQPRPRLSWGVARASPRGPQPTVIRGPRARPIRSAVPLCALIIVALAFRHAVPNWVFMWMMAGALFFGCKWITFLRASHIRSGARLMRSIGYFIAWPGMDAPRFFGSSRGEASKEPFRSPIPLLEAMRLCLGLVLLWVAVHDLLG